MIPSELVDQFSRGKGALFVGAGLSMAGGLPSWGDIIEPLRDEIDGCPSDASYTDVAQYFEVLRGRGRLVDRVLGRLREAGEPTPLHDALLSLQPSIIFTTNYDRLIEDAARGKNIKPQTIARNEHARSSTAKLQVVKVHGDIDDPSTIVITTKDYLNFYHTRKAIADRLKVELQYQTPLFIGYSFRDWNLASILAQIEHEAGDLQPSMYCLQFKPTRLVTAVLKDQGLDVIPLESEPGTPEATAELLQWLNDFSARVAAARDDASTPVAGAPHNLRPRRMLHGREGDLEGTFRGLRSRYPLIAIQGFPGVGKTSLALEVGHCSVATEGCVVAETPLFKFVVWISAEEETDQKLKLTDMLKAIAATTGLRGGARLAASDYGRLRSEVESLLASTPVLIIVDQHETIEDPELDEWLENIASPSKVLITTTSTAPRVKAWPVYLEGLPPEDCRALMKRHAFDIGLRPAPDRRVLDQVADAAARNPQAMKLALGLIRDGRKPGDVVDSLRATGADVFQELLEASWSHLSEPAKRILCATPLFQGIPSIRPDALAAASGVGADEARFNAAIDQCVRLGLLEHEADESGELRYKVHSITRSFASAELQRNPDFEGAAAGGL
ncbi:MAG: hypothetical protein QOI38_1957, partial [Sphingomonadales bacterium]|nr:hypothetical protein [Sphingomonadales bacterium]